MLARSDLGLKPHMAITLKNRLEVTRDEFNRSMRAFRGRKIFEDSAGLAFENGVLSLETGNVMVTLRGTGEWQGCALFSAQVLAALAKVPPTQDPVVIEYSEGKLFIGPLSIPCYWETLSAEFVGELKNPGVLDLLALGRSMPAAEIHRTGLWRRINRAKATMTVSLQKAAKQLGAFEISESELRDMVEVRIRARLKSHE